MRDYVIGNSSRIGWHGTSYGGSTYWLNDARYGFIRGNNGMFSFHGNNNTWAGNNNCGRGVAVVGTGL